MRYILSVIIFLTAWSAGAQDKSLLDKVCQDVAKSCVTLEYTYTARLSGIDNNGSGVLVSQDDSWNVKGNGVEMYCDGASVWVVDPVSREVIIEPLADEQKTEFITNPARIFLNLDESFKVNSSNVSSDGKAQVFSLAPVIKSDLEYLNVEILKDASSIRQMSFALTDGTFVTIKVSSMKLTPKVSVEIFKPQMQFDSKWIVTDMR